MKTEWKDSDVIDGLNDFYGNVVCWTERRRVIGGWLVYRDLINEDNNLVLTSTVIFIDDPDWKWEITDTE